MGTVTVEGIAKEFLHLLDEGWTPDLEEFLHHVPEEMRDECRQRIQELTAPPEIVEVPEPEPAPEPEPSSGPQRLSPEEARRMFAEMEARRAGAGA